jgi:hypothetical protein
MSGNSISQEKLRFFLLIILLFSFFHFSHYTVKIALTSPAGDFGYAYFQADLLKNGIDIYHLDEQEIEELKKQRTYQVTGVKAAYHPFVFLTVIPFTFFSFKIAYILWSFIHTLLYLIVCLSMVFLLSKTRYFKENPMEKLLFTGLSFFIFLWFGPFFEHIAVGQQEIPVLFLLMLSFFFHHKNHQFFEGFFFAIPILIKPQFILLLPLYFLRPRLKVWVGIISSLVFWNLVSIYFVSFSGLQKYLANSGNASGKLMFNYGSINNHSFSSMLIKFFGASAIATYFYFVFLIVMVFLFFKVVKWQGKISESNAYNLSFASAICFLSLASPYVQNHYLVLMLLPLIILFYYLSNRSYSQVEWIKLTLLTSIGFVFVALQASLGKYAIFHKGWLSLCTNVPLFGNLMITIATLRILHLFYLDNIQAKIENKEEVGVKI